jgi:oligopeptide/dipeptide ABC transporter ATP-binding protein
MATMGLLPRSTRIDGSILYDGNELVGLPRKRQTHFRGNEVGMIFQDPMTSLNPVYTVGWQIAEAVRAHAKTPMKQAMARAVELLELVGIPQAARRVKSYPHEFSGGMRQRVMIAMSMANNPQLLIADEPTTALDVTVQAQILETLVDIQKRTNIAIILITHDLGVVAGMTERILVMYAGRIVESATAKELFGHPHHPYTVGLLRSVPRLDEPRKMTLQSIEGLPPDLAHLPRGCAFAQRCVLRTEQCRRERPVLLPTTPGRLSACFHSDQLAETAMALR